MAKPTVKPRKWALYVYMCADVLEPGMKTSSERSLQQILNVGSSDEVGIAVQIARADHWTYRYLFPKRDPSKDLSLDPSQVFPTTDSASPYEIQSFFTWAAKVCPAEKIMFVLFGHGFGLDYYVPDESPVVRGQDWDDLKYAHRADTPELLAADFFVNRFTLSTEKFPHLGHVLHTESLLPTELPPDSWSTTRTAQPAAPATLVPPIVGTDSEAQTVLLNNQMGDVARAIVANLPKGQTLEILGFDSCEMALIEVWSEMQETASIGIASEATLPYLSWPYDTFLKKLLSKPDADAVEVAKMLTTSFAALYKSYPTDYVTLSACAIPAIKSVNAAAAELVKTLLVASRDLWTRQQIFTARNFCPQYDRQGYIDFGCFCRFLTITLPDTLVSKAAANTLTEIQKFVVDAVYSPPNKEKKISQSTGVSVWMPEWIENPDGDAAEKDHGEAYLTQGYVDTWFACETGWDQFLTLMCARSWGIGSLGQPRNN